MQVFHGIWQLLAVAVGTVAGYLGLLRFLARKGRRNLLPGRFNRRLHLALGIIFYCLIFIGAIIGWVFLEEEHQGEEQEHHRGFSPHHILPVPILVLYAGGGITGAMLSRGKGGRKMRPVHMALNYSGCALVAVQVISGLILLAH